MKNNKLHIAKLKVQSFVTSIDDEKSATVKGAEHSALGTCPTGSACDTGVGLCTPTYGSTCARDCQHSDACGVTEDWWCR